MTGLKRTSMVALAGLALALAACGGGSNSAKTPKPPQAPVETPTAAKANLDTLASSVVMVAPGTLQGSDFEPVATGSGTIVDKSGLILTNYHVVDPDGVGAYDDIAIYTVDDPRQEPSLAYFGGLAAWDADLDLAVIRITENRNGVEMDPSELDLPVVSIGDPSGLDIGQTLTVLGYPAIGGGSLELTKGSVSGFLTAQGQKAAWIKTDARIAAGNSGGGAFNDAGELVGIPTAIYYVDQLGTEGSGRIRPVDLASGLLDEARATTSAVIPKAQSSSATQTVSVPLISLGDVGAGFVLGDESSLTNEDRAAVYDDPQEALSFYETYGRVGGVRRSFDDFDSAEAAGVTPTVIVVQADVYSAVEGAAGAASDSSEFLDTMWEFVTAMGFQFHKPQYVSDPGIGDQSYLYTAQEMVTSDGLPLMLAFVGFRQANVLVVVGVLSLDDTYHYQMAAALAAQESSLLSQSGASGSSGSVPTQRRGTPAPSTLSGETTAESAIGAYLNSYDIGYAGDCDSATGADVGSYCSTLYEDRGTEAVYLAGPTFSEYDSWFLVERNRDGSWSATDAAEVAYDSTGDMMEPPW